MIVPASGLVTTLTDVVFSRAHCPAAGVKVNITMPCKPAGNHKFPLTPVPLQLPATPLWVVFKVIAVVLSQTEDGGGVLTETGTALVTFMLAVFGSAHCPAAGVNVSTTIPFKPVGLKVLPTVTPLPLQVPAMPLWVALSVSGAAVLHTPARGGLLIDTGAALATFTVVVLPSEHCPAAGVKASTTVPLKPAGVNRLPPETPLPLQMPVMPLWVVLSVTGASRVHRLPVGSAIVTGKAALTAMVAVLGKTHCPTLGVKVSVTEGTPIPEGLNTLPDTPFPLHTPNTPFCTVLRFIGASSEHKVAGGGLVMVTADA